MAKKSKIGEIKMLMWFIVSYVVGVLSSLTYALIITKRITVDTLIYSLISSILGPVHVVVLAIVLLSEYNERVILKNHSKR